MLRLTWGGGWLGLLSWSVMETVNVIRVSLVPQRLHAYFISLSETLAKDILRKSIPQSGQSLLFRALIWSV